MRAGRSLGARLDRLEILWLRPEPALEVEDDEGRQWVRIRSPGAGWRVLSREAWEAIQ